MADDEATTSQEETTEPAATTEETPPSPQTEAQNAESARISGLQRAHNAETAALRAKIAEQDAQLATRRQAEAQASAAEMTEAQRAQQRADALERELEAERAARVIDQRRLRYPEAAAFLPEKAFAVSDEGELAGLTERLKAQAEQPSSYVDPNRPPKAPAQTAKPITEKTAEELKGDLTRLGPAFAQDLRTG